MLENANHGMRIVVASVLGSSLGVIAKDEFVTARKAGVKGVITTVLPGHGGEWWGVEHDNPEINGMSAVYHIQEMTAEALTTT